jgi:hypothetical protein
VTDAGDGFREPGLPRSDAWNRRSPLELSTDVAGFPLTAQAFEGNRAETVAMVPVINASDAAIA